MHVSRFKLHVSRSMLSRFTFQVVRLMLHHSTFTLYTSPRLHRFTYVFSLP